MRTLLLASALLACPSIAWADQLAQCRDIAGDAARLKCYDRLASALPPSREPAPVTDALVTAAADPVPDISGFYVAGGLNMGVADSWVDSGRFERFEEPGIQAVAGFNHVVGRNFVGAEIDVRAGLGENFLKAGSGVLPGSMGSMTVFAIDVPYIGYPGAYAFTAGAVAGRSVETTIQERFSPGLNFRFGRQIGDWTVFGKAGGGISMIDVVDHITDRVCVPGTATANIYLASGQVVSLPYASRCASTREVASQNSASIIRPTATFGLGVERHFDRYFARLDGEVRHIFYSDGTAGNGITQFDVGAMVGVKF